MSTTKKRSAFVTGLLFVLAIGLLLFSAVGSARAALNVQSEILQSDIGMLDIGVDLTREKTSVSGTGDNSVLFTGVVGEDEEYKPGAIYDFPVSVTNTGGIDEYVRVVIYKYWLNKNGEKDARFDPDLIVLPEYAAAAGWTKDTTLPKSYDEREVWYYTGGPLAPTESVPFLSKIQINDDILTLCTQTTPNPPGNIIYTVFEYDGAKFCIEIEADGVQTHNAQQAILSAWGKSVTVTDGGPISGIS